MESGNNNAAGKTVFIHSARRKSRVETLLVQFLEEIAFAAGGVLDALVAAPRAKEPGNPRASRNQSFEKYQ